MDGRTYGQPENNATGDFVTRGIKNNKKKKPATARERLCTVPQGRCVVIKRFKSRRRCTELVRTAVITTALSKLVVIALYLLLHSRPLPVDNGKAANPMKYIILSRK